MCPKNDSSRPYIIFTGLPVWSASRQAWTCIERSSRPPNAPPTPASEMPHLVGRQVEAGGDLVAVDVQPLGGDEQVDAAVLGRHREAGLGPEERLVLHADLVVAAHHDVGGRPRVAVLDPHVPQQVADGWSGSASNAASVSVTGSSTSKSTSICGGRVARGLRVVGGDDRDRLALVADLVQRQHGLVGDLEPVILRPGTSSWVSTANTPRNGERGRDVELA